MTSYAEAVRALLRAGFSNRNIIDMAKGEGGRDEVILYGEEAIKDELLAEEGQDEKT